MLNWPTRGWQGSPWWVDPPTYSSLDISWYHSKQGLSTNGILEDKRSSQSHTGRHIYELRSRTPAKWFDWRSGLYGAWDSSDVITFFPLPPLPSPTICSQWIFAVELIFFWQKSYDLFEIQYISFLYWVRTPHWLHCIVLKLFLFSLYLKVENNDMQM